MTTFDNIAPARDVDALDFADLTTAQRTGPARWVGEDRLEIPFNRDLTADEAEAVRVRITSENGTSETETLRRQALTAFRANRDYLALTSPTSAQVRDQVTALTRQMQALIRLAAER